MTNDPILDAQTQYEILEQVEREKKEAYNNTYQNEIDQLTSAFFKAAGIDKNGHTFDANVFFKSIRSSLRDVIIEDIEYVADEISDRV